MAFSLAFCTLMSNIPIAFGVLRTPTVGTTMFGGTISFLCMSYNPHEVRWMKRVADNVIPQTLFIGNNRSATFAPSRYAVNVSSSSRTSQLTIYNTQVDDSGVFACKQNNAKDADTISFDLAVQVSLPVCSIDVVVDERSPADMSFQLTCTVGYGNQWSPPAITCLPVLPGENVSQDANSSATYRKTFSVARTVDNNMFSCTMVSVWSSPSNNSSTTSGGTSYTYRWNISTSHLQLSGHLASASRSVGVVAGQPMSFSCTTNQSNGIRWTHRKNYNLPVPIYNPSMNAGNVDSRYSVTKYSSNMTVQLNIHHTKLDDGGAYVCSCNSPSYMDKIFFDATVLASQPTCSITTRPLSNSNLTFLVLTCTVDYNGPCPPVISCLPEFDNENVSHSNSNTTVSYSKRVTVEHTARPDTFTCKVDFWSSAPGTTGCDTPANSFTWSVYEQNEAIDRKFLLAIIVTAVGIVSTVVIVVLVARLLVACCCPKRRKWRPADDATDPSSPAASTNGVPNIRLYSMVRKTNSSQKAENTVGRDQNDVYNETPQVPCYVSESKYINAPDDDRVTWH